jgi:hypothetical protein
MGAYAGVEPTWAAQTNAGRTHIATKGVVQSGLVLNLDAGASTSYPGSGTTWTDLSGNGNTGTLTNGPTYSSSDGGSIVFDGVDDYVQTPFSSLLTNISISVWFNATVQTSNTGSGLRPIVMLGDFSTQGPLEISILRSGIADAGKMRFEIGSDDPVYRYVTSERYDDENWYNAVLIKDNTTMRVYINGNLIVERINDNDNLYDTSIALRIGGGTALPSRRFVGKISNVSTYNRALTASEISQNFNALRSRFGI